MILAIALMIAVYGTGRLLNDCFKWYDSSFWSVATWIVSIVIIAALWSLAVEINLSGMPSLTP